MSDLSSPGRPNAIQSPIPDDPKQPCRHILRFRSLFDEFQKRFLHDIFRLIANLPCIKNQPRPMPIKQCCQLPGRLCWRVVISLIHNGKTPPPYFCPELFRHDGQKFRRMQEPGKLTPDAADTTRSELMVREAVRNTLSWPNSASRPDRPRNGLSGCRGTRRCGPYRRRAAVRSSSGCVLCVLADRKDLPVRWDRF